MRSAPLSTREGGELADEFLPDEEGVFQLAGISALVVKGHSFFITRYGKP